MRASIRKLGVDEADAAVSDDHGRMGWCASATDGRWECRRCAPIWRCIISSGRGIGFNRNFPMRSMQTIVDWLKRRFKKT